jgi:hypothetical protein
MSIVVSSVVGNCPFGIRSSYAVETSPENAIEHIFRSAIKLTEIDQRRNNCVRPKDGIFDDSRLGVQLIERYV